MRLMRAAIVGLLMIGCPAGAAAQDMSILNEPVLRGSDLDAAPRVSYQPGSPVVFRWEGLYFGGQVGRTMSSVDFGGGVGSLVNYILRNDVVLNHVQGWITLPRDEATALSYGGFVGYNAQFQDAVLGIELNYNRSKLYAAASDSLTRYFQDDTNAPSQHHFFYNTTLAGNAWVRITDFATIRARAAWAAGNFLPYAFAGLAVARADVYRAATVTYTRTDLPDPQPAPTPPITPIADYTFGPSTRVEQSNGSFAYGYTAGLGIDMAILPNVFVRAEWEWVQLMPFKDLNVHLNTVRTAVGVKF
jgi:opacity protein-like surface antigen